MSRLPPELVQTVADYTSPQEALELSLIKPTVTLAKEDRIQLYTVRLESDWLGSFKLEVPVIGRLVHGQVLVQRKDSNGLYQEIGSLTLVDGVLVHANLSYLDWSNNLVTETYSRGQLTVVDAQDVVVIPTDREGRPHGLSYSSGVEGLSSYFRGWLASAAGGLADVQGWPTRAYGFLAINPAITPTNQPDFYVLEHNVLGLFKVYYTTEEPNFVFNEWLANDVGELLTEMDWLGKKVYVWLHILESNQTNSTIQLVNEAIVMTNSNLAMASPEDNYDLAYVGPGDLIFNGHYLGKLRPELWSLDLVPNFYLNQEINLPRELVYWLLFKLGRVKIPLRPVKDDVVSKQVQLEPETFQLSLDRYSYPLEQLYTTVRL